MTEFSFLSNLSLFQATSLFFFSEFSFLCSQHDSLTT